MLGVLCEGGVKYNNFLHILSDKIFLFSSNDFIVLLILLARWDVLYIKVGLEGDEAAFVGNICF